MKILKYMAFVALINCASIVLAMDNAPLEATGNAFANELNEVDYRYKNVDAYRGDESEYGNHIAFYIWRLLRRNPYADAHNFVLFLEEKIADHTIDENLKNAILDAMDELIGGLEHNTNSQADQLIAKQLQQLKEILPPEVKNAAKRK